MQETHQSRFLEAPLVCETDGELKNAHFNLVRTKLIFAHNITSNHALWGKTFSELDLNFNYFFGLKQNNSIFKKSISQQYNPISKIECSLSEKHLIKVINIKKKQFHSVEKKFSNKSFVLMEGRFLFKALSTNGAFAQFISIVDRFYIVFHGRH